MLIRRTTQTVKTYLIKYGEGVTLATSTVNFLHHRKKEKGNPGIGRVAGLA
jgi:hypothetical protein